MYKRIKAPIIIINVPATIPKLAPNPDGEAIANMPKAIQRILKSMENILLIKLFFFIINLLL